MSAIRRDHASTAAANSSRRSQAVKRVDVFARPIEKSVSLDRVTTCQGEAILTGNPKTDFRRLEEAGIPANRPAPEVAGPTPGSSRPAEGPATLPQRGPARE